MSAQDKIKMARISLCLIRGRVLDASVIAAEMDNPALGSERISDWKRQYADLPHGQWGGTL